QARRVAVLEERAAGARLLDRLVTGEVGPADVDRVRAFGFNLVGGGRVAILGETASTADRRPLRLAELVERHLITAHTPHLIKVREADVMVLLGVQDEGDTAT